MNVTVENIMTPVVVCATSDFSVQELMQIMDEGNIHCVPIIDKEGHCIGVVSGADLVRWHKIRKRSTDVYAHEILSHPIISVNPEAKLQDAVNLMVSNNVHHLVVLNQKDLIGIVSVMDVLKHCNQEEGASKTRIIC